jgi:hypothetical protein
MSDETAPLGGLGAPSDHYLHLQNDTCEECSKEMKRLSYLAAGFGMVVGIGAVLIYARTLNRG